MEKLVIVDLEKNYHKTLKNCSYICVNRGTVNLQNAKKIPYDLNHNKKNLNKNKKDLIYFFLDLKKKFEKKTNDINSYELEIFNLRNDKYDYLDKILIFYELKKKKLHKKYKIEIFTDKDNLNEFYRSVFGNKININCVSYEKKIYNDNSFLLLKYLKFIIRAFYFIILTKIFKKNRKLISNSELYLSFYPYFFKNENIDLYNDKKKTYLNFSLTDETHLNLKPNEYIKHIKKLSNIDSIISTENFIKYSDLFYSIKKFIICSFKLKNLFKDNYKFKGIDCTNFLVSHLKSSFLNRSKLFIYDNSFNLILRKYNPKKLHYFLFEYNFGFFLKNKFDVIEEFTGYQHGIYNDNLMWLDLINYKRDRCLPQLVICNRKKSIKAYKQNFKKIIFKKKKLNIEKNIKINKTSSKILVFLGQHDIDDSIYFFINNKKFKKQNIFFKVHPNNKKNISIKSKKLHFVRSINKKFNYRIYFAPTTTLIYDFYEKNLNFKILNFSHRVNLWY